MTRNLLVALGLILTAGTVTAESEQSQASRLDSAMARVESGALPDTAQVADDVGRCHRVYCDSFGLWYQTGAAGDTGSVAWGAAIALCRVAASNPTLLLFDVAPRDDARLWVIWKRTDDGVVRCRRKWLSEPTWSWSAMLDLTPSDSRQSH